jgi:hypothetical protein
MIHINAETNSSSNVIGSDICQDSAILTPGNGVFSEKM